MLNERMKIRRDWTRRMRMGRPPASSTFKMTTLTSRSRLMRSPAIRIRIRREVIRSQCRRASFYLCGTTRSRVRTSRNPHGRTALATRRMAEIDKTSKRGHATLSCPNPFPHVTSPPAHAPSPSVFHQSSCTPLFPDFLNLCSQRNQNN